MDDKDISDEIKHNEARSSLDNRNELEISLKILKIFNDVKNDRIINFENTYMEIVENLNKNEKVEISRVKNMVDYAKKIHEYNIDNKKNYQDLQDMATLH